jgi:hypothetical protein
VVLVEHLALQSRLRAVSTRTFYQLVLVGLPEQARLERVRLVTEDNRRRGERTASSSASSCARRCP